MLELSNRNASCPDESPPCRGHHTSLFYQSLEERQTGILTAVLPAANRSQRIYLSAAGDNHAPGGCEIIPCTWSSPVQAEQNLTAWRDAAALAGFSSLLVVLEPASLLKPFSAQGWQPYEEVFHRMAEGAEGGIPVCLLCLFDASRLPEADLHAALQAHPWLYAGGERFVNEAFLPPTTTFQSRLARITARRSSERELERSEMLYRTLSHLSPDGILLTDLNGQVRYASPRLLDLMALTDLSEIVGRSIFDFADPSELDSARESFATVLAGSAAHKTVYHLVQPGGQAFFADVNAAPVTGSDGQPEGMVLVVRDLTEWSAISTELRDHRRRLDLLMNEAPVQTWTADPSLTITSSMGAGLHAFGMAANQFSGVKVAALFPAPSEFEEHEVVQAHRQALAGQVVSFECQFDGRCFNARVEPLRDDQGQITGVIGAGLDVTEDRRAHEALYASERMAQALLDAVQSLAVLIGVKGEILALNEAAALRFQQPIHSLLGQNVFTLLPEDAARRLRERIDWVCQSRRGMQYIDDPPGLDYEISLQPAFDAQGSVTRLAVAVHDISDLLRVQHQERKRRQVAENLRAISKSLSRAIQFDDVFEVILQGLQRLIPNAEPHILVREGERLNVICPRSAPDTPLVRRLKADGLKVQDTPILSSMAADYYPVLVTDLTPGQLSGPLPGGDRVRSYAGAPILVGQQVYGFLGLASEQIHAFSAEQTSLLESFANQAAMNIQKAQVFAALENSHQQLSIAYEATIAGWARALEMRDKETEGHSQRVVDLTERLARLLGVPASELDALRWGALLHDIGKMGIPDNILLKPGPLTDDEWISMRQHPRLAYEMLSGIPYLNASLTIPFSHHEHWDGTGYPLGLKGEEIPLPARIFAVVDTYDALSSDRPYRLAWQKSEVLRYLHARSGTQFDPQVVKAFFDIIQE